MTAHVATGSSRRRDLLVDAALALPLAVLTAGGTFGELIAAPGPHPPAAGAYVIAVAAAATTVWRRRRPALVACACFLVASTYLLAGYPGWAPSLALFVALFTLAAYGDTNRSLIGALGLSLLAYLLMVLPPARLSAGSPSVWGPLLGWVWVSLLGASVRQRRLTGDERLRRANEIAAEQTRRRIADDRVRIARDLHDVLAHTIAVIAVQSGVAADALDDDRETARQAIGTIRSSTRQALTELRATLTVLRDEAVTGIDASLPTRPQPRLAEIETLAERARQAGLAVTVRLPSGDVPTAGDRDGADAIAPAVELTVYRVVQEALTHVIRHARARTVSITLDRHEPDGALVVTVHDDGHGDGGQAPAGFGIRGMRGRVEALGGTFRAGPDADGGFTVRADLPI